MVMKTMDKIANVKGTDIVVRITTEYDQFKYITGNRDLNKRSYAKLINSMQEEQLIIPIIVNENKEIVDGQHRFYVCKELGKPVYYIEIPGYSIEQVKRANMVSSVWTKEDFLSMHVDNQRPVYLKIKQYLDESNINLSDIINLIATIQGKTNDIVSKAFESGNLNLSDTDYLKIEAFLEALSDFKEFDFFKTRQFVRAFMKLYFHDHYDHSRMKDRIQKRKRYIVKRNTIDDYLSLLTKDVYSFGAVKKPLYYDAEKKSFWTISV